MPFRHHHLQAVGKFALVALRQWAESGAEGTRSEAPAVPPELWDDIRADRDTCTGRECRFHDACFFYRARARAGEWRDAFAASLENQDWTPIDVRDGEKGPLVVQTVKVRVQAKKAPGAAFEETLVVIRERQGDGALKHDYYLSNAPSETPLAEFARVSKAEHRVEECLQRAKSEAGLADYEVRTWRGWHHHQTLSLIATWFLTRETRQGGENHALDHGATSSHDRLCAPASQTPLRPPRRRLPPSHTPAAAN